MNEDWNCLLNLIFIKILFFNLIKIFKIVKVNEKHIFFLLL